MKDNKDLQNDILRMQSVNKVLNNAEYQNAFMMIKAHLLSEFEGTKFKQHEERDEVWRKIQSLNFIEGQLTEVMQTGKIAELTLADKLKARF